MNDSEPLYQEPERIDARSPERELRKSIASCFRSCERCLQVPSIGTLRDYSAETQIASGSCRRLGRAGGFTGPRDGQSKLATVVRGPVRLSGVVLYRGCYSLGLGSDLGSGRGAGAGRAAGAGCGAGLAAGWGAGRGAGAA